MSGRPPEDAETRPRRVWPFALALLVFHVAWFCHYVPPAAWWSDRPIAGVDFETHVAQTWRFLEAVDGWGATWVYDVRLLAGYPHGVIFDADNKGWEVWTWALRGLGLSPGFAFNLFVVFAHLGVLAVVALAARLLGLGRVGVVAAAWLASLLWLFDSFAHWCWWIGMIAYAIAAFLCLLPLALFHRWLRDRRTWQAVLCALALGAAHLVHPYTFVILVWPMLAMWLRARRELGVRGHLAVVGIAAFTVLVNLWWLVPSLRFWHYILDSGYFGQAGLGFFGADYLGLVLDTATSGLIGTRTGFRFLVLGTCLIGLVRWRRAGDPRFLPFAVAVGAMAALAYFGAYVDVFRQIQPYRHVLPLAFLATIPAAAAIEAAVRERAWTRVSRPAWLVIALVSLPAVQHLARDVLYYSPELLPEVAPLYHGGWQPLSATGYPPQPEYRLTAATPEHDQLGAYVREHDDGQARFLVEEPAIGEMLTWQTDAQIVGGFLFRNLQHSYANLFRRRKQGVAGDDELRTYFETYAIGWVIVSSRAAWWDRRPEVLTPVTKIGHHRIFRTTIAPHLIQQGGGRVRAATNRIDVTGSDPNVDLVLRYHWMEYLSCEPGCEVVREPIDGFDQVGFVRVPAPHPADLSVRNTYGEEASG